MKRSSVREIKTAEEEADLNRPACTAQRHDQIVRHAQVILSAFQIRNIANMSPDDLILLADELEGGI